MSLQDYEKLFDEWGEHCTNLGIKYIKCHGKSRDRFESRNTKQFLRKTTKKILGRSYRIYKKIRKLNKY